MASANNTVISIAGQSIVDAEGNTWSIVDGQVAMNGVADPATGNVIEMAYENGTVWQENAAGLWWSKSTPSDQWGPTDGTLISPVQGVARMWTGGTGAFATPGNWAPAGAPQAGDTAIIGSGDVSMTPGFGNGVNVLLHGGEMAFVLSGSFNTGIWAGSGEVFIGYPGQDAVVTTAGLFLTGGTLDIRQFVSTSPALAIVGNSRITGGAVLDAQLIGTGSLPRAPIENNGTMTLSGSTLQVGELTGQGVVRATGNSSVSVIDAVAGETIQLVSGHLTIGGGAVLSSTAMQFLAPVTDFGATSEITLANTQATSAVFSSTGAAAGQLLLYDGSTMVADLRISGQAHIYVSNVPAGLAPGSVLLTAYDTGHSILAANGAG
jgi:hypothetical protein